MPASFSKSYVYFRVGLRVRVVGEAFGFCQVRFDIFLSADLSVESVDVCRIVFLLELVSGRIRSDVMVNERGVLFRLGGLSVFSSIDFFIRSLSFFSLLNPGLSVPGLFSDLRTVFLIAPPNRC